MINLNNEVLDIFNKEIQWRNKASKSLVNILNEYDDLNMRDMFDEPITVPDITGADAVVADNANP